MRVEHDTAASRFLVRVPEGVESTFVPSAARGRGVGAALVERALEHARNEGYVALHPPLDVPAGGDHFVATLRYSMPSLRLMDIPRLRRAAAGVAVPTGPLRTGSAPRDPGRRRAPAPR